MQTSGYANAASSESHRHFDARNKLAKGSPLIAIEVGSGLMLVPLDVELERLSGRIGAALAKRGVGTDRAVRNLAKVRRRRFERLHGAR